MRIKIIGEGNCARATRHLLRVAGFAVTEYLPADAVVGGPLAGYCITIDLAPAALTPDSCLRPDPATHDSHASGHEGADRLSKDASSPSFSVAADDMTRTDSPSCGKDSFVVDSVKTTPAEACATQAKSSPCSFEDVAGARAASIHFDSVDSVLEAAVLRHVSQLAAAPVIVDRPGGVVHSERELRIVAPNSGD